MTDAPCRCRYLSDSAQDPDLPIIFDAELREYHFQYQEDGSDGPAYLTIYHCPFCGGAAPKSRRALLFHAIPRREEGRLARLLEGLKTIEAFLRAMGEPEWDTSNGMTSRTPERAGSAPEVQHFRMLHYQRLSKVADVWVTEHEDGRASWRLVGKPRSRPSRGA